MGEAFEKLLKLARKTHVRSYVRTQDGQKVDVRSYWRTVSGMSLEDILSELHELGTDAQSRIRQTQLTSELRRRQGAPGGLKKPTTPRLALKVPKIMGKYQDSTGLHDIDRNHYSMKVVPVEEIRPGDLVPAYVPMARRQFEDTRYLKVKRVVRDNSHPYANTQIFAIEYERGNGVEYSLHDPKGTLHRIYRPKDSKPAKGPMPTVPVYKMLYEDKSVPAVREGLALKVPHVPGLKKAQGVGEALKDGVEFYKKQRAKHEAEDRLERLGRSLPAEMDAADIRDYAKERGQAKVQSGQFYAFNDEKAEVPPPEWTPDTPIYRGLTLRENTAVIQALENGDYKAAVKEALRMVGNAPDMRGRVGWEWSTSLHIGKTYARDDVDDAHKPTMIILEGKATREDVMNTKEALEYNPLVTDSTQHEVPVRPGSSVKIQAVWIQDFERYDYKKSYTDDDFVITEKKPHGEHFRASDEWHRVEIKPQEGLALKVPKVVGKYSGKDGKLHPLSRDKYSYMDIAVEDIRPGDLIMANWNVRDEAFDEDRYVEVKRVINDPSHPYGGPRFQGFLPEDAMLAMEYYIGQQTDYTLHDRPENHHGIYRPKEGSKPAKIEDYPLYSKMYEGLASKAPIRKAPNGSQVTLDGRTYRKIRGDWLYQYSSRNGNYASEIVLESDLIGKIEDVWRKNEDKTNPKSKFDTIHAIEAITYAPEGERVPPHGWKPTMPIYRGMTVRATQEMLNQLYKGDYRYVAKEALRYVGEGFYRGHAGWEWSADLDTSKRMSSGYFPNKNIIEAGVRIILEGHVNKKDIMPQDEAEERNWMVTDPYVYEVPIKIGAPIEVNAVWVQHPVNQTWHRVNRVKYEGLASKAPKSQKTKGGEIDQEFYHLSLTGDLPGAHDEWVHLGDQDAGESRLRQTEDAFGEYPDPHDRQMLKHHLLHDKPLNPVRYKVQYKGPALNTTASGYLSEANNDRLAEEGRNGTVSDTFVNKITDRRMWMTQDDAKKRGWNGDSRDVGTGWYDGLVQMPMTQEEWETEVEEYLKGRENQPIWSIEHHYAVAERSVWEQIKAGKVGAIFYDNEGEGTGAPSVAVPRDFLSVQESEPVRTWASSLTSQAPIRGRLKPPVPAFAEPEHITRVEDIWEGRAKQQQLLKLQAEGFARKPKNWNKKERDALKDKIISEFSRMDDYGRITTTDTKASPRFATALRACYDLCPDAVRELKEVRIGRNVQFQILSKVEGRYMRPGPFEHGPRIVIAEPDQMKAPEGFFSRKDPKWSYDQRTLIHEFGHHGFENVSDAVYRQFLVKLSRSLGIEIDKAYPRDEIRWTSKLSLEKRAPEKEDFPVTEHLIDMAQAQLLFEDNSFKLQVLLGSEYAASNFSEFMAEAWASYVTNHTDPPEAAIVFGRALQEAMNHEEPESLKLPLAEWLSLPDEGAGVGRPVGEEIPGEPPWKLQEFEVPDLGHQPSPERLKDPYWSYLSPTDRRTIEWFEGISPLVSQFAGAGRNIIEKPVENRTTEDNMWLQNLQNLLQKSRLEEDTYAYYVLPGHRMIGVAVGQRSDELIEKYVPKGKVPMPLVEGEEIINSDFITLNGDIGQVPFNDAYSYDASSTGKVIRVKLPKGTRTYRFSDGVYALSPGTKIRIIADNLPLGVDNATLRDIRLQTAPLGTEFKHPNGGTYVKKRAVPGTPGEIPGYKFWELKSPFPDLQGRSSEISDVPYRLSEGAVARLADEELEKSGSEAELVNDGRDAPTIEGMASRVSWNMKNARSSDMSGIMWAFDGQSEELTARAASQLEDPGIFWPMDENEGLKEWTDRYVRGMLDKVNHARRYNRPAYHGQVMNPRTARNTYKVGEKFPVPLMATSQSRELGEAYADPDMPRNYGWGVRSPENDFAWTAAEKAMRDIGYDDEKIAKIGKLAGYFYEPEYMSVLLVMEKGHRSVFYQQNERIVSGDFRISKVEEVEDVRSPLYWDEDKKKFLHSNKMIVHLKYEGPAKIKKSWPEEQGWNPDDMDTWPEDVTFDRSTAHWYDMETGEDLGSDPRKEPEQGLRSKAPRDAEQYVTDEKGHVHWGANGAAGVLIRNIDANGTKRYLLQYRSPLVQEGNTWSIPGGALAFSETPEQGALREAQEEMQTLPDLRPVYTYSDDHGGWAYHTVIVDSPNRFISETGTDAWETGGKGFRWFTAEEIDNLPLHSGFKASWAKVRREAEDRPASTQPAIESPEVPSVLPEGLKSEAPRKIMWHVTGQPNVQKIQNEGLRTNAGGFDAGYIWLFDDLATARAAARSSKSWGGYKSDDLDIIAVDVTDLPVIPDPHGAWGKDDERTKHSFAIKQSISADRIISEEGLKSEAPRIPDEINTFYQYEGGTDEDGEPIPEAAEVLPAMEDSESAKGLCVDVAKAYADHVRERGGSAEVVDVLHRQTGYAHTVVLQNGLVVDWSARQFDPNADIPTVTTEEKFFAEWRRPGLKSQVPKKFYRLHRRTVPWTETPTSQEFRQSGYDDIRRNVGEKQPGYSSFDNPWHLWDYIMRRRWEYDTSDVAIFTGEEVGRGVDDEPLAMPKGEPQKMPWDEFQKWLLTQPMGSPPAWKGGQYNTEDWGDPEAYMNRILKEYDLPGWERKQGIKTVVIGQTPDYGPKMPSVWYVRGKADHKTIRGGFATEAEAREYAESSNLTIVEGLKSEAPQWMVVQGESTFGPFLSRRKAVLYVRANDLKGVEYKAVAPTHPEPAPYDWDVAEVEADLGDKANHEAFTIENDLGSGCDDIARSIEEKYNIPQVWGFYMTEDGRREPHSWNETEQGTIVDAARYVFAGEQDAGLFVAPRGAEETDRYSVGSDDPSVWDEGLKSEAPDYRGMHRAPGYDPVENTNAPMDALDALVPEDIYTHPQYYSGMEDYDWESFARIRQVRGHPGHVVRVYRAVPKDVKGNGDKVIQPGDWVTPSRKYAKLHGESNLNGEYRIVSKIVTAQDLFWDANSLNEFGYDPSAPRRKKGEPPPGVSDGLASKVPLWRMPKPTWVSPPEDASDDEKEASLFRQMDHAKTWEWEVRKALSRGDLTPQEAWNLGYKPNGHDMKDKGAYWDDTDRNNSAWEPLPETLYHVTTNKTGVLESGRLLSRRELHQLGGAGLGGGEDDTISFTEDKAVADNILRALHEYHDVLSGKKPLSDLIEEAKQGGYLDRVINLQNGSKAADEYRATGELPLGMRLLLEGKKIETHDVLTGKTTIRPITEEELLHARSSHYKAHATFREYAGGPMDPGFIMNDAKEMLATNPDNYGIITAHPKPGAQGYKVSALGEWRTVDGTAVEIVSGLKSQAPRETDADKLKAAMNTFRGGFDLAMVMRRIAEGESDDTLPGAYANNQRLKDLSYLLRDEIGKSTVNIDSWRIEPLITGRMENGQVVPIPEPVVGDTVEWTMRSTARSREDALHFRGGIFSGGSERSVLYHVPAGSHGLAYDDGREFIMSDKYRIKSIKTINDSLTEIELETSSEGLKSQAPKVGDWHFWTGLRGSSEVIHFYYDGSLSRAQALQRAKDEYMAKTGVLPKTGQPFKGERIKNSEGLKSEAPTSKQEADVILAVRSVLTDDLLKPEYRNLPNRKPTTGHCYAAAEATYHLLGGHDAGLTPMHITHEGQSHWYLRTADGKYIDPTSDQFETPVPYDQGKGQGFLTTQPSIRASIILQRIMENEGLKSEVPEEGHKFKFLSQWALTAIIFAATLLYALGMTLANFLAQPGVSDLVPKIIGG